MTIPTPAVYIHLDALEGEGRELVGRRSAGTSFLKGWLAHVGADPLHFVVDGAAEETALHGLLADLGETRPLTVHRLQGEPTFAQAGCVFFPAPGYRSAAWRRQRTDPARCSLVGITHTVSTWRVKESLHTLLAEPVEPWDAIICTSRAVHSVVARQLTEEEAYYRGRFAAARVPMPQLPVIPLGIQAADFVPRDGARERMRDRQGVPPDAVVVMTMGRLSVVEKANPVPLFLALNMLASEGGPPLHLWLVGWSSREKEADLHRSGAEALAKGVTVSVLDGRDPDIRRDAWAGADVFTLPADSIQETFGLVPVEAMAAGLPVVMPDWNGFRDTVRDGEFGFLVTTRMAPPGGGLEIARRFADGRDGYLGHLATVQSQVHLDVPSYARALRRLIGDPALRARMGNAGRAHVRANLDWSAIIPRYLELAAELARLREGAVATTPGRAGPALNPLEIDLFELYAGYPGETFDDDRRVRLRLMPSPRLITGFDEASGRKLYGRGAMKPEALIEVCDALRAGPASAAELAGRLGTSAARVRVALLLLLKSDLVRVVDPDPSGGL